MGTVRGVMTTSVQPSLWYDCAAALKRSAFSAGCHIGRQWRASVAVEYGKLKRRCSRRREAVSELLFEKCPHVVQQRGDESVSPHIIYLHGGEGDEKGRDGESTSRLRVSERWRARWLHLVDRRDVLLSQVELPWRKLQRPLGRNAGNWSRLRRRVVDAVWNEHVPVRKRKWALGASNEVCRAVVCESQWQATGCLLRDSSRSKGSSSCRDLEKLFSELWW